MATWKTPTRARRTDLEITMLTGVAPLPEDAVADQAAAAGLALDLSIDDIRRPHALIRPAVKVARSAAARPAAQPTPL